MRTVLVKSFSKNVVRGGILLAYIAALDAEIKRHCNHNSWIALLAGRSVAVYRPGGGSSADGTMMRHSGREFGLVLCGTLSVTVGFDDHLLAPGDAISFHSSTPHRLRNDGMVEVRAVWVALGCHGLGAGHR